MELDHLGVAVRDLSKSLDHWRPLVGPPEGEPEVVASQRVRVAFLPLGSIHLELLEPTDADGPVARFVSKRGEGLHHVAFRVPDVQRALDQVRATGRTVIDTAPRPGARGRRVGFVHPSGFDGVLVEFVEGG